MTGKSNPEESGDNQPSDGGFEFEWDDSGDDVVLGIDEAGRGPVLGPMVYACALCKKSDLGRLKQLGVDDSKQLTEEQREALRAKLDGASFVRSLTRVLHASEISEKMLRRVRVNLNVLSHDAALHLVSEALRHRVPVTEVYVDTVGTAETYAQKFRATFPQLKKVVVEKKADAKFAIVGAASIVAKTTRDRMISSWKFPELERARKLPNFTIVGEQEEEEEDDEEEDDEEDDEKEEDSNGHVTKKTKVQLHLSKKKGSGYPSDPTTKAWMEANCDSVFGFPTFVRFSWGTTKTLLEKKGVQVDWASDEEDAEASEPVAKQPRVKTKDIKSFFTSKASTKSSGGGKTPTKAKAVKKDSYPMALKSLSLKRAKTLL